MNFVSVILELIILYADNIYMAITFKICHLF